MEQTLADAVSWIIVVIFWAALLFPPLVGTFWKWWQTAFGQSYMLKTILLGLATSSGALHVMFGTDVRSITWLWYTAVSLGLIPAAIAWRGVVLWREQRAGRPLSPLTAVRDWYRSRRAPESDAGQPAPREALK